MIYIHTKNEPAGPYEVHVVLDQLKAGLISPDDMAIRHGETEWKPLRVMFPGAATPAPVSPMVSTAAVVPTSGPEPQYRNTIVLKVIFGLCFLGALLSLAVAAYLLYSLWGASGDLMANVTRGLRRNLALSAVVGTFVGGLFTLLALLLVFKRRLIQSNGLRLALRVLSILALVAGIGNFLVGAGSYLTYSDPAPRPRAASNEMLDLLDKAVADAAVGPYQTAVIILPIGAGLFLLGLSGLLMTKRPRD